MEPFFGHPSSFLTPPKKAKLSLAGLIFPKIREVLFARYLILVDVYIDEQGDTIFFMSIKEVKNHRDGTRFFIPLQTSFFSQLRAKIAKTASIKT